MIKKQPEQMSREELLKYVAHLKGMIHTLQETAKSGIDSRWRSMKTAPKDGTRVLLKSEYGVTTGYYASGKLVDRGWYVGSIGVVVPADKLKWMPLPE